MENFVWMPDFINLNVNFVQVVSKEKADRHGPKAYVQSVTLELLGVNLPSKHL